MMAEIGDRPRWLVRGLLPGRGDAPVLVIHGNQPAPADAQEISPARVRAALPRCLTASDGRRALIALYRAVVALRTGPPRAWTDREITDQLLPVVQDAFDRRRLVAYATAGMGHALGGTGPGQSQPPPSKPPPVKPPPLKPPPVKPPKIGPPKIEWVQMVSLTIHSDHQMMKDNLDDWLDAGVLYPEPEWTGGQGCALSHSMNRPVELTVELMVGPPDAASEPGVLQGKAVDVSFESEMIQFVPGPMTIALTSKQPIDPKIRQSALSISWDVDWWQGDMSAPVSPTSTNNVMYVTWDTPHVDTSDDAAPEDGVTHRRMKRAVEWVESIGSTYPHDIVKTLFQKVPDVALHPNDAVPSKYKHPGFFNDHGGAWPLTDHPSTGAQCQAIVRMVRAIIRQLGLPGAIMPVVVWVDPDDGGATVREAALGQGGLGLTKRSIAGHEERAKLFDREVKIGQVYLDLPGNPGMNSFEACLRYDYDDMVRYHGGGMDHACETIEEIINVFWGLVWIWEHDAAEGETDSFTVTDIVRVWNHQWK